MVVLAGLSSLWVAVQPTSATFEQFYRYVQEGQPQKNPPITAVSQLSDVYPTDWAFQALQSLVERFGCIAGYPDGTFRGDQALSRYEFAAGLNACLQQLTEILHRTTDTRLTAGELISLQRLQNEFAAELSLIRHQTDRLEVWAENFNQFSTTTKFHGEAIFAITDAFSSSFNRNQTVFQHRLRFNLKTSFTGRDLLLTQLEMGKAKPFDLAQNQEGIQTFNILENSDTSVRLNRLSYQFLIGENISLTLAANGITWDDFVPTLNPNLEDHDGGNGSLSAFGQRNPIYRIGGGTGIGFHYPLNSEIALSAGYLAANSEDANDGNGLLNGDYATLVQMTVYPTDNLQFAFTYNHGYSTPRNFGFNNGLIRQGWTGTGIANSIGGLTTGNNAAAVVSHSYGIQLAWQIHSKFTLSGWGGYTTARLINIGDSQIWNYAITLGFPDLFQTGSLGGIIIGREPYLSHVDSHFPVDFPQDASWHLEAFYRYQLTDSLSITPGFIWITNPNQNQNNDDILMGTVRATFTF